MRRRFLRWWAFRVPVWVLALLWLLLQLPGAIERSTLGQLGSAFAGFGVLAMVEDKRTFGANDIV